MLTGNTFIAIMVTIQTLAIIAGVCYYLYKSKKPKKDKVKPVIEVEALPKDGLTKGFGYLDGKSLLLNEDGEPYLFKTFLEAQRHQGAVPGAETIVYQKWDMDTQTVFLGEVTHGSN